MLSSGGAKGLHTVISILTFINSNVRETKDTGTKVNIKFIEPETEIEVAALAFVQTLTAHNY